MMFRPRWPSAGPMGGDGFALPAGTWSLIRPTTFFATTSLLSGSNGCPFQAPTSWGPPGHPPRSMNENSGLLDLTEIQLHRRRAAEDQDGHADLALLVVHFLDAAVEVRERAFRHAHRLAYLEQHLRLGLFDALLHLVHDVLHFLLGDGRGPHRRAADEAGHLRRAFHQVPGLVGHLHL